MKLKQLIELNIKTTWLIIACFISDVELATFLVKSVLSVSVKVWIYCYWAFFDLVSTYYKLTNCDLVKDKGYF